MVNCDGIEPVLQDSLMSMTVSNDNQALVKTKIVIDDQRRLVSELSGSEKEYSEKMKGLAKGGEGEYQVTKGRFREGLLQFCLIKNDDTVRGRSAFWITGEESLL